MSKSNLESLFQQQQQQQQHFKTWWQLTVQRTPASQGTLVFYEQWRKILDYSDEELDIQDTRNTGSIPTHPRLYLSLSFLPEKHPRCLACTCTHPVMSLLQKQCHLVVGHTLTYTLSKFEVNQADSSWDISIFVSYPLPGFTNLTTRDMASEPTPQQLITQSAEATADSITSVLTARTASISLPIYDWDSQDAYHSFSIFCCTLENWLLLNHIPPDSEDHLRYVFAALGTKSLEMHAQWMLTSSKEEQKATKVKASAFLNWIQQGMTHNVNTHVHLGELEDIVARPGEDPQDLITCIKTLMDCCKMINDEHHEHKLHCHIIHAYCHEGKLLGKLMAKPFKTPYSKLADIAVNHFAIQHAQDQVSHSSKPVDTICQDKRRAAHTSHNSSGHTPSAPSKNCPNCTQQHPAGSANCLAHDSCWSKCDKMGHWGPKFHGGKPLQPRNAPPPRSQQRKSRCPPRNHNMGWLTRQTPYMSVRTTALKMI